LSFLNRVKLVLSSPDANQSFRLDLVILVDRAVPMPLILGMSHDQGESDF